MGDGGPTGDPGAPAAGEPAAGRDTTGGVADRGAGGFWFPRTPSGRASLVPPPPWFYSGEMLTIEYLAEPGAVAALLPPPLEPVADRPDAVAAVWAEWQSCSESGAELLDPVRAQYRESLLVVRCRYRGRDWSRCVFIWVDQDLSLARGLFQGYPKKLGQICLTRPALIGRAGPRLAPGGRFGASVAAGSRRLLEAEFTITGEAESAGFVNAHPMLHHRVWPAVEADGSDAHSEIVSVSSEEAELGTAYVGEAALRVFPSPTEELEALAPREMLGGFWRRVGFTFRGGRSLSAGGSDFARGGQDVAGGGRSFAGGGASSHAGNAGAGR